MSTVSGIGKGCCNPVSGVMHVFGDPTHTAHSVWTTLGKKTGKQHPHKPDAQARDATNFLACASGLHGQRVGYFRPLALLSSAHRVPKKEANSRAAFPWVTTTLSQLSSFASSDGTYGNTRGRQVCPFLQE